MGLHLSSAPAGCLCRICRICLIALLCWSYSSTAMAGFQRTRIVVLDFAEQGEPMEKGVGAVVAAWFTEGIARSGRFDVTDRTMLNEALAEQGKPATDIDDGSAARLGKRLGAKVVATGSVVKERQTVQVHCRVISVEHGEIIVADSYRDKAGKNLHDLVDTLADRIVRNFPLTGYVVKKSAGTVVIDLGLDSGLAPGTEFIVYREGEIIRHPTTGEILDVKQIPTGRLRITRISKNVAEGKILSQQRGGIREGQLIKSMNRRANLPRQK